MVAPISTEAAVLLALSLFEKETYGFKLIENVAEATSGRLKLRQGCVYPVLDKLKRKRLVSSFLGEKEARRGGRRRRFYKLTAAGLKRASEIRGTLAAIARLIPR